MSLRFPFIRLCLLFVFSLLLYDVADLAGPERPAFLENLPAVQPRARVPLPPPDVGGKWELGGPEQCIQWRQTLLQSLISSSIH